MCCSQRLGGIPHQHDLHSALALAQLSPVVLPWYFTGLLLLAASLPDPQLHGWGMLLLEARRGTAGSCLLWEALSCLALHTGLRTGEVWSEPVTCWDRVVSASSGETRGNVQQ